MYHDAFDMYLQLETNFGLEGDYDQRTGFGKAKILFHNHKY